MATNTSLEPASSSKVEKPALVAPRHSSTSSSLSPEKLAMANRAELLLKANEAVKVYKEQTSSVPNMADAAATAAIAALSPCPSIIVNPMVANMEAIANVVETNCARKLGTPKPTPQPAPQPPTRQSARVRSQGAVKHTPGMNDSDASGSDDDDRLDDPDNISEEDAAEGESD